jgi:predicted MFS family arabinose efflux permease
MATISSVFGWRTTAIAIACVAFAVIPVIALFLRDRPSDVGLMPYGETGDPKPAPRVDGNPLQMAFGTLREASRVRDFWLLAGTYFACGASTNGLIGTHLIPACIDNGFTEVTGAALLATMGVFNFIGTTSAGWLSDRFDNRVLLSIYYGLRGISLLILPYAFANFYVLTLFAVFYGLDWFATVSPTVRLITGKFGREKAGLVYGWVFTAHQMGGASAAFFGGLLREEFGGYLEAFMISGLICLLAAFAALFIGGPRPAPEPAAPAMAKAA